MAPILRALAAAALAASEEALTVTDNGTYLAIVTLDSIPVKLLVDMWTSGVWVRCSALDGPSCLEGEKTYANGYGSKKLARFDDHVFRKNKRFNEVIIAGHTFTGFDAFVVYDALPQIDTSIQGVLGLQKTSLDSGNLDRASMYNDAEVTTVGFQLGLSSADSKLSLDTIDQSLLMKKGLTTKVTASYKMDCFQVPFSNGSTGACTSTYNDVIYDPALPYIGLPSEVLKVMSDRFLRMCIAPNSTSKEIGYTCNPSIKIPRLTMQISSWELFLDPKEYTMPIAGSSQVQVLIGERPFFYLFNADFVLGAPFLRKYAYVYDSNGPHSLYCSENTTCTKILSKSSPSANGGGGSSTSEDDRRRKLYLSIGFGLGGVALLVSCWFIWKLCKSDAGKSEAEEPSKTSNNDATVALTVGMAITLNDGSDESDVEKNRKSDSMETTIKAASAKRKHGQRGASKKAKKNDSSCSSDEDSDASSSYDSESSEERRRERRRRSRRRRSRRREREWRRQQAMAQGENGSTEAPVAKTVGCDDHSEEVPYVAASSPKNVSGVQ